MPEPSFAPEAYLDFSHTEHAALFAAGEPVWSALKGIGDYLAKKFEEIEPSARCKGYVDESASLGKDVFIGEGAVVEAHATIKGPAWIGPGCTVRAGAYVRENVITGAKVMLGNSSEFKNCLIFDNAEIPHFNYVGDSILGYKAHLGAGVILSNVRLDRNEVTVRTREGGKLPTGLRKFGAIIGDRTEIGCNSVISPGGVLGRGCIVYPCTHFLGVLKDGEIVKNLQPIEIVPGGRSVH